jgi:hypothetical protein
MLYEKARPAAVALALTLLATRAQAEQTDADKQLARELMTQGRAARDAGDAVAALAAFSRAHAIMHVPTTLLETARAHFALGQWLEARAVVQELEAVPSAPGEPPAFARARAEATDLGHDLELRMPTLRLDLNGSPEPETTTITIDGAPRPDCTQACWLNPGKHSILARSRSSQAEEQVSATDGAVIGLELVFSPRPHDMRPLPAAEASCRTRDVPRTAPPAPQPLPKAVWILGGVAVAGAVSGAVLGLTAVSERDSLRESCAPGCSSDRIEGVRRRALVANLSFGIGAAAAAGALAAYVFQPAAPAARASRPRNPQSGALTIWGSPAPAGAWLGVDATF